MTRPELELKLEHLEDLFDEVVGLVEDPDISDGELRDQLCALLEEASDDE